MVKCLHLKLTNQNHSSELPDTFYLILFLRHRTFTMASGNSDTTDFPGRGFFHKRKRSKPESSQPKMPEPIDKSMYRMDKIPRGKAIIINNKTFVNLPKRKGTDIDRDALKKTFEDLLFEVEVHNNKTVSDTKKILKDLAAKDFSDENALIVCLLTHGDEGIVYATDGEIYIKEMIGWFKKSDLTGKPKMFIFQACQGEDFMDGVDVTDAPLADESRVSQIPIEADFLYAYSTVPGYMSWRNTDNGSWFIQSLVEIFNTHAKTTDVLTMLTRVNALVATFQSRTGHPLTHNKMQIPSILSMLRKDLYFFPENVMERQVTEV